jgi:hypothetical protein
MEGESYNLLSQIRVGLLHSDDDTQLHQTV